MASKVSQARRVFPVWARICLPMTFAYFLVCFVINTRNHFPVTPVLEDDYFWSSLLSFNSMGGVRPLACFVAAIFNHIGTGFFYFFFHIYLILYSVLALSLVLSIFELGQKIRWEQSFFCGMVAYSYYWTFIYPRSLGHIVAALSTLFGTCALLFILKAYRSDIETKKGKAQIVAAALCSFLSYFSKEDFILPIVLSFCILICVSYFQKKATIHLLGLALALTVPLAAWFIYNYYIIINPHTAGLDPSYQHSFNPLEMAKVARYYLFGNGYQKGVTLLSLAVGSFCIWKPSGPNGRIGSAGTLVIIFACVIPYSVLLNKREPWYVYNWLVWQSALIVVGIVAISGSWRFEEKTRRILVSTTLLMVTIAALYKSNAGRVDATAWFRGEALRSSRILSLIAEHQAEIRGYPVVGVVLGHDPINPWYRQTGEWFRSRMGLNNHWIIFAPKDSAIYRVRHDFHYDQAYSKICVLSVDDLVDYQGMPMLIYDEDGRGSFRRPLREVTAGRIDGPCNIR